MAVAFANGILTADARSDANCQRRDSPNFPGVGRPKPTGLARLGWLDERHAPKFLLAPISPNRFCNWFHDVFFCTVAAAV